MSEARQHDDLDELRAALRSDAAGVAEALLGAPNKAASDRNTLRWGNKGSLALEVRGAKSGLWFSHEIEGGSDLLGLVQHVRGCSFPEAVRWARARTGIAGDGAANDDGQAKARRAQQDADRRARRAEQDARDAAEEAVTAARRIAAAQGIAAKCVPLEGTLGAYYLKQVRGIPPDLQGRWPDAIRFHPRHRALVAIATTASGTVQAVQRVHLAEDGSKVGKAEMERRELRAIKVSNGVLDGAAVRLPGSADGPLLLAEGPETGLAAWSSSGLETWIALGGIAKLAPPAGRRVVVCRDDDKRHSPADKKLAATVNAWRKAGNPVVVVTPWPTRRWDKSDLADVILASGVDAVKARIEAALRPAGTACHRVPIEQARAAVAQAVGAFFDRVDALSVERAEWDRQVAQAQVDTADRDPRPEPELPPGWDDLSDDEKWDAVFDGDLPEPEPVTFTHGVRVDVGVGKSRAAVERAADLLAAMRERGDKRTVVLAIPRHDLGDEHVARFMELPVAQATGLRAATWRGRAAPDPAAPGYDDPTLDRSGKKTMCGDLDRVYDAQEVGLHVQTAACRRRITGAGGKKRRVTCPLYEHCAYQAQRKVRADLWVVAHDLLFSEKPAALGEVAALVVDEAAWQAGLDGAAGQPITLSLHTLAQGEGVSDRLHFLRSRLLDALGDMPNGPIRRDAFGETAEDVGGREEVVRQASILTADGAAEAIKAEWARKVDPNMHPGMNKEERRTAKKAAERNRVIPRLAMAWNAIRTLLAPGAPEASGWAALDTVDRQDGPVRVLRLKGRKNIRKGWKAPTLLLDALLPVDLVRPFWPDVQLVAEVLAQAPHQHVHQVVDKAYSKAMLEPLADAEAAADPEEARRRLRNLRDLRAVLVREARGRAPGKVLAVLQKDVRKALAELGPLPGNLELGHHNNLAGRDEWRDVAALVVVGRTMPSPGAVERIAEALTGQAVAAPAPWYDRADAARELVDGTLIPAEGDRHPDPTVEAIRWQVAEGELVQIIGRARGVNRGAADPVDVLVLTNVPLPVPLAGMLDAAELDPTNADLMLAEGGIVLENARHAAAAYPSLWPTHAAAAKAAGRERSRTFPYKDSLIGECPTPPAGRGSLVPIRYQVAGAGQKAAGGSYDPALRPDPAAFLAERLGALASCEVEDDRSGPEPPNPSPELPAEPQPPDPDPVTSDPEPTVGSGSGLAKAEVRTDPPPNAGVSPGAVVRRASRPDLAAGLPPPAPWPPPVLPSAAPLETRR